VEEGQEPWEVELNESHVSKGSVRNNIFG
jgi:hypothetical protein